MVSQQVGKACVTILHEYEEFCRASWYSSFNIMTISLSFWLQDKEFLPSKIQKQNLDLVKKLNGKTGRELVEFVGELLGEVSSESKVYSNVSSSCSITHNL